MGRDPQIFAVVFSRERKLYPLHGGKKRRIRATLTAVAEGDSVLDLNKTTEKMVGLIIVLPLHCKKRLAVFPSPARMSLTKLSLPGKNLIIPRKKVW
jgi:hypothetical protein